MSASRTGGTLAVMRPGDLCSVEADEGRYRVVKILKVEDGVAHIRLYAGTFAARPTSIDPASLDVGTMHDADFGVGHLPVDVRVFESWDPAIVGHAEVLPGELDGYEIWRDAVEKGEGGVWGAPEPRLRDRILRAFRR